VLFLCGIWKKQEIPSDMRRIEWTGRELAKIGVQFGDGGSVMSRMLKGCQRRMIVVQGKDKGAFETAYFVLRRESERRSTHDGDLLEEANRIINEQQMGRGLRHVGRGRAGVLWLLWLSGVLIGGGGMLLAEVLLR
jgi:hypothetical protein